MLNLLFTVLATVPTTFALAGYAVVSLRAAGDRPNSHTD
jgi:hypothetical protein